MVPVRGGGGEAASRRRESSPSAAYVLDVTRPTQSLFYDRQASLEGLSAYLNEEHE